MIRIFINILLLLIFTSSLTLAASIDKVEYTGSKRIPEYRVSQYLIKVGEEFNAEKINNSIKMLHGTGYFSEVEVDFDITGNELTLTYIVTDTPIVVGIEYFGNKKITNNKMQEVTLQKIGSELNLSQVAYTLQNIIASYEKKRFYGVNVVYRIEYVTDTTVNVVFDVVEGEKSRVYNIWFYGNETFDDVLLKKQMRTREKDFWAALDSSGTLETMNVAYDMDIISKYYKKNGYINIELSEPEIELQKDPSRMNYIVRVNEGEQYFVGSLRYRDPDGMYSEDELKAATVLKKGEVFNVEQYSLDMESIRKLYTENGYAEAYVDDSVAINTIDNTVDIIYTVVRGDLYKINRLVFKGNEKTYDNVLRREFDIVEGELYNSALLEEGVQNLRRTGFLTDVKLTESNAGGYSDITVDVAEKERDGTFMLMVAYSSLDHLTGKVEVTKQNLFGTGREVGFSVEGSDKKLDLRAMVFDPWIFDSKYSAGATVYYTSKEYDYYDLHSKGAELRLGRQLIKRRLFLDTRFGHDESDVRRVSKNASNYIKKQEGLVIQNYITPSLVYSSLDSNMDPRQGLKTVAALEFSGTFLGGNTHLLKATLEGTYYHKLPYSFVGSLHAKAGQIYPLRYDREIPIEKRFYLGGMYSIRGFQFRDISPKDEDGDPYGGNKFYQINAEVWRSILEGSISVRAVAFFDMGMVYNEGEQIFGTAPRKAVGGGIRFITPLGVLRMEYGYKLDRKKGESSGEFEFTIGNVF